MYTLVEIIRRQAYDAPPLVPTWRGASGWFFAQIKNGQTHPIRPAEPAAVHAWYRQQINDLLAEAATVVAAYAPMMALRPPVFVQVEGDDIERLKREYVWQLDAVRRFIADCQKKLPKVQQQWELLQSIGAPRHTWDNGELHVDSMPIDVYVAWHPTICAYQGWARRGEYTLHPWRHGLSLGKNGHSMSLGEKGIEGLELAAAQLDEYFADYDRAMDRNQRRTDNVNKWKSLFRAAGVPEAAFDMWDALLISNPTSFDVPPPSKIPHVSQWGIKVVMNHKSFSQTEYDDDRPFRVYYREYTVDLVDGGPNDHRPGMETIIYGLATLKLMGIEHSHLEYE